MRKNTSQAKFEKKDMAYDKKMGIKENSGKDIAMDKLSMKKSKKK